MNQLPHFELECPNSEIIPSFWCHTCRYEFQILSIIPGITCRGDFCEEIDPYDTEYHPKNFVPFDGREPEVYDNEEINEDNDNNDYYSGEEGLEEDEQINENDSIDNSESADLSSNSNYTANIESQNYETTSYNAAELHLITSHSELSSLPISGSLLHRLVIRELLGSFLPNHLSTSYDDSDSSFDAILQHIMESDPNTYGAPPVSKKILDKLPLVKVTHDILQKEGPIDCAVCKEEFTVDEELNQIPCNHRFHKDCIMPWLKQHNSCPICRFELPTDDLDYENKKIFQTINNHTQSVHNQGLGNNLINRLDVLVREAS